MWHLYYSLWSKIIFSFHYRFRKGKNELKDLLIKNNQTRWLDLGSSVSYNDGFYFVDIHEPENMPEEMRSKYFKMDFSKPLSDTDLNKLGKFDFIRMQHVFEHFMPEDGLVVLENCYKILNTNGYLLITVPDLDIYVERYRRKSLTYSWVFTKWAQTRVAENAPQSFYFSVFTHSLPYQQHLWCYDKEGLIYQIQRSGKFAQIKRVGLFDSLCNINFTHNRPLEDLCVLAVKA